MNDLSIQPQFFYFLPFGGIRYIGVCNPVLNSKVCFIRAREYLARHIDADPEIALREANAKFERRFGYIERTLAAKGCTLEGSSLAEMDALWNEAKTQERT